MEFSQTIYYTVLHQELTGDESTTFCGVYFYDFDEANNYALEWANEQWPNVQYKLNNEGIYKYKAEYIGVDIRNYFYPLA
ncbi:hypothetical protein GCM10028807_09700 [Spirosoma daeguense]